MRGFALCSLLLPAGLPVSAQDLQGLQVPFKIAISRGGRSFSDVAVKDDKINTGLNPLEFARKPQ